MICNITPTMSAEIAIISLLTSKPIIKIDEAIINLDKKLIYFNKPSSPFLSVLSLHIATIPFFALSYGYLINETPYSS